MGYSSYKMLVLPKGNVLHRNERDPGYIWPSAITQTSTAKLSVAAVSPVPVLLCSRQETATQTTELVSPPPLIALLLISNSDGRDGNTPCYTDSSVSYFRTVHCKYWFRSYS